MDLNDPSGTDALPSGLVNLARAGWRVIQGGGGRVVILIEGGSAEGGSVAGPAGALVGVGLAGIGGIVDARLDFNNAQNAEDAANAQLLQAIHNWNQVMLARPRPALPLAGRYTPAQQRQIEHDRYKDVCSGQVPLSPDPCSNLSREIDRAKRCISLMQSFDDKWMPRRHAGAIQQWLNGLNNLKDQYDRDCTSK